MIVVLAAVTSAVVVGALSAFVIRPRRRLAGRVRPYTIGARTSLGRPADVPSLGPINGSLAKRLLWPMLEPLAVRAGRMLEPEAEDAMSRRLRQARFLPDLAPDHRLLEYRVRALAHAVTAAVAGAFVGSVTGRSRATILVLVVGGAVAGYGRYRGRIDRTIEDNRERIRIELYTVNQLLAMNLRVGGGIVQATGRVVQRGSGLVVDDLATALRIHATGRPLRDALLHVAEATPEPTAARTYRLLAAGAEHGADLASSLLEHADDVREARRESLQRQATRRRAGMLIPTIAILAPVMLLFIAAPIPSIVFGIR